MKLYFVVIILVSFLQTLPGYSYDMSEKLATAISEKIWKNECRGTIQGLTTWNQGENFGSFGIGHFIWYPKNEEMKFKETFPSLLEYIQSRGIQLPEFLKDCKNCPWNTREEFYKNFENVNMIELRRFLYETKTLQALFITQRLDTTLKEMGEKLSGIEYQKIRDVYNDLAKDSKGLYAMIDYLNFKGDGISKLETYEGKGWGLLQVLQRLSPSSNDILRDFVEAAKAVLVERVKNSPQERQEKKWLKGWINRVNTYLEEP